MTVQRYVGNDRYRLIDRIGKGAHAKVWRAEDTKTGDRVAVKIITLSENEADIAALMFKKEVDALTELKHANIVRLIDYYHEKEEYILVLELVSGQTLSEYIVDVKNKRTVRPNIKWRLENLLAILGAIDEAHRNNVIHRDLKPSNILYDRNERTLKIVDYGVARILSHYGKADVELTLRNFHSPPYAAPEQLMQEQTGFAVDIYAFGVICMSILTLNLPDQLFRPDFLVGFLEGFKNEMGIDGYQTYNTLEDLLLKMLHLKGEDRPRIYEIERVLRSALASSVDKIPTKMVLTNSARRQLLDLDKSYGIDAKILDDLNYGLKGSYQDMSANEEHSRSFVIHLYGKTLYLKAKPDSEDPEQLIIISGSIRPPELHERDRDRAFPLAFAVDFGEGNSKELIDSLYEDRYKYNIESLDKKRRSDLFEISRFLIEAQRRRQIRLELTCTKIDRPEHSQGWRDRNEFAVLRIDSILPESGSFNSDVDFQETEDKIQAIEKEILDSIDEQTSFNYKKKRIGVLHSIDKFRREITIRLAEGVSLPSSVSLTAYNAANEASLKRQEMALRRFSDKQTTNLKLMDLLVEPENNKLGIIKQIDLIQNLKPAEDVEDLVSSILAAEDIFLLQGPPGTGKTSTISEVIAQILIKKPDARILLTSQANEAVNNALDRVRKLSIDHGKEWRILRHVSEYRKDKDGGFGLDPMFDEWVKKTRQRCIEGFEIHKTSYSPKHATLMKQVLMKWAQNIDKVEDVKRDYADAVQVYGVTCLRVPTLASLLTENTFDWVIVDEAAKATWPEVLVSMLGGKKILLVGDHRQLPPLIEQTTQEELRNAAIPLEEAKKSLFEYLFERINESNRSTLNRQYRMHESIAALVSKIAYSDIGGLKTGVAKEDLEIELPSFRSDHRVFWIGVKEGKEEQSPESKSFFNQIEANEILKQLKIIDEQLEGKQVRYSIGVIAPYSAQIKLLKGIVMPSAKEWKNIDIDIDTVDAFQGKEKEIIIYSMTRSSHENWKFVSDKQRLNVAFSRAKRLLLVFGNTDAARYSPQISSIISSLPAENILSEVR